ncbi:MAG: hypothetical protein K8U57_36330 [Planctomycetes bacterium]|nr:hypothetical protein [Planctomycetota bacterium]
MDGADVRSIDAVREWHAALSTYGDTLSEALAGVEMEIQRAHDWLAEQLSRWQFAIRDFEDEVTRAKAELSQRKFVNWDGREPDCTVQEKNLRMAKARLEHAEDQVLKCRQWLSRLPKLVDETYSGSGRRLANFLEAGLPRALADLVRRIGALESYAGMRTDYAPAPSATSVQPTAAPPGITPPNPEQPS